MRGAHLEHVAHVRDAGRVPAGNVLVEILQSIEEVAHVGDARDVPVGDGAVRRNSGCLVSVDRLDRRVQGVLLREGVGRRRRRRRRGVGRPWGWRRRRHRRRRGNHRQVPEGQEHRQPLRRAGDTTDGADGGQSRRPRQRCGADAVQHAAGDDPQETSEAHEASH
eukprot:scaffold41323_cov42-Phaeocystis_antarctica.AAC.2